MRLATLRGAPMLGTLDVLFAVPVIYGSDFDRALYVRARAASSCSARSRSPTATPAGR